MVHAKLAFEVEVYDFLATPFFYRNDTQDVFDHNNYLKGMLFKKNDILATPPFSKTIPKLKIERGKVKNIKK